MSREIKFRAWQPRASLHRQPGMYLVDDMVWHKVTDDQPEQGEVFLTRELGSARSSEFFNDVTLMQYTGLKDKNGVEIYERDILRYVTPLEHRDGSDDTNTYEVLWDKFGFTARWLQARDKSHELIANTLESPDIDMEVIGNIYENPELLKAAS